MIPDDEQRWVDAAAELAPPSSDTSGTPKPGPLMAYSVEVCKDTVGKRVLRD